MKHHEHEVQQKTSLIDKVKTNIPFFNEVPVDHVQEVETHPPQNQSLMEKVRAKLPFGHQHEAHNTQTDSAEARNLYYQEGQQHPSLMEKLKAGLICGGQRHASDDMMTETRNMYYTEGQAQPALMERIKASIPFGHHQEGHTEDLETREMGQTQSTFMEKVKARIPVIVDKIESRMQKKRTEISTQTESVEAVQLPAETYSQAPVDFVESEIIHHHRRPIFESVGERENLSPIVERESIFNKENIPPVEEEEEPERKAVGSTDILRSETDLGSEYQPTQPDEPIYQGEPAQLVRPDSSLQEIPATYNKYETPSFEQSQIKTQTLQQESVPPNYRSSPDPS